MKYRLLILILLALASLWSLQPTDFSFNQSSQQCFYFIESASLDGNSLTEGDWIGAFKDDICVGSAQWSGSNTTIPLMGDDGFTYSSGYCLPGDVPDFKVWDSQTDLYWEFSDNSEISSWTNNGTYLISYLRAYTSSPKIEVSSLQLDLGNIVVGQEGLEQVIVSNIGEEVLIGHISASNDFYLISDGANFQIEPADSIIVEIGLNPDNERDYGGVITIISNSAINPEIEIQVSARGIMAHISSNVRLLPFNNVWKDHEVIKSLSLLNDGSSTLFIEDYTFSVDCFRLIDGPSIIPAGEENQLSIAFLPTAFQVYNSTLTISTNVGEYNIEVSGTGYLLNADFTTAQDSVEIGNRVYFINNSQGEINNYNWNFDDLDNSNQVNPSYLFPQIGLYEVTLQVSDEYFTTETSKIVLVYGVAEGSISTHELEFLSNYLGVPSDTLTLAIYSTRTADLLIDSFNFRDDTGAYSLLNEELPEFVAPNDSLVIEILFTPVSSGNNIDFLNISTNAGTFTCLLEGIGLVVPPKTVENITIVPSNGNVDLQWDPVSTTILDTPANISYYKVEASTTPTGPFVWIGISPTNSFTQFGVANYSQRYFYRIIAVSQD